MVWIHGGALVTGESNDYDPTKLVEDGVTVVTINYRLGALGFLADPALADANGQSGDYGLMDQQAALRWVQRNIAGFGGDPRNVTIFGESAGGLSVLSQVASPAARGLFARAIAESGPTTSRRPRSPAPRPRARRSRRRRDARTRPRPACAACRYRPSWPTRPPPGTRRTSTAEVLPQSLQTAFATGEFNRVPIINGTNHDEWRLFVALSELQGAPVTAANYQAMIASTLGVPASAAAVIAAEYPLSAYPSPSVALGAVGTDAIFACPALTIDQTVSNFVPDIRLRIQRRERAGELPAAREFPLRRRPRVRDPVPHGPAHRRLPGNALGSAAAASYDHEKLLDKLGQAGIPLVVRHPGLASL